MAIVKFIVTCEREAERLIKEEFNTPPVAAGRDPVTGQRFWYVKGRRCVMKPTQTQSGNGAKQYLVTVE